MILVGDGKIEIKSDKQILKEAKAPDDRWYKGKCYPALQGQFLQGEVQRMKPPRKQKMGPYNLDMPIINFVFIPRRISPNRGTQNEGASGKEDTPSQ